MREPELILQQPPRNLGKGLRGLCQPVEILDRQVKADRGMMTMLIKVRWEGDGIQEDTWESEPQMRIDYPKLFRGVIGEFGDVNSGSNSLLVGESCNDPNSGPKNSGRGPKPYFRSPRYFVIKTPLSTLVSQKLHTKKKKS